MLLNKQTQILVFEINDSGAFDNIGVVDEFSSIIWPSKNYEYAQFELKAPVTERNKELLKKDHIIWCEGSESAAIIDIIDSSTNNETGEKVFTIKGRTLEVWLTTRIIWGTYNCSNKYASTIMYELVDQNCINPTDSKRKIPFLELATDECLGNKISYQKTGGEVYESITTLAQENELAFKMIFKPEEKKVIFVVRKGVDRTIEQTINDPVVFSTDLEDILSSSYYYNSQSEKTIALVAGEDGGENRKKVIAGNNELSGLLRKELYVDARDVQSEVEENGEKTTITDEEYNGLLMQRGNEKLSECKITETFEATVRVVGDVQYEFGKDYFENDKVTMRDEDIGIQVSAQITEVEESFGNEYSLVLTFGYSFPTMIKHIKRQL